MQVVTYVCDSAFRNRIEYPMSGMFAIEPMVINRITGTTDNYCLAAPYDHGTLAIPAFTPATSVSVVQIEHSQSMPIDHFYMGHLLTLFGSGKQRVSVNILDSVQYNSKITLLTINPELTAPFVDPNASTSLFYWITQTASQMTTSDVTVIDNLRLSLPKSMCNCVEGNEHAVIVYEPNATSGYPLPNTPFISFVNNMSCSDPKVGCKRPREPPSPPPQDRCIFELATPLPGNVMAATSLVVDLLVVNGVTNGNNVGNTRWVTSIQNMIFNTRWPRQVGSQPNTFRVRLEQVLLPTAVPIRQMRTSFDSQLSRDNDTQRNGGFITDFAYVVIELALNRQAEYHTVMVPSQSAVMGSFLAVMDTYRSPIKTFVVARCSTSIVIPTNVWEHILITIRLPNGDILDFLPHPTMARRVPYAGADPLRQIQAIFVVDGMAKGN